MNDTAEPRGDGAQVSSGMRELDLILGGGFSPNSLYLVEGAPGTGKTTLALQFLLEGVRLGEPTLFVTLSETATELQAVAASHGWSMDGITIHELVDPTQELAADSQYTMFQPAEVELGVTTKAVLDQVERLKPRRMAFDSLSEMRLLSQSSLRFRRQILALKQFFVGRRCTVLLLDDKSGPDKDLQLHSMAHGVIHLDHLLMEYGGERRRLRVTKYRGRQFLGGYHDFDIRRGGLSVYPRNPEAPAIEAISAQPLLSGNASLDALLGEGLARGSSTLLLGPAGVGKSSCATMYAVSAVKRGERAAIYSFDESRMTLLQRSAGLGMDLTQHLESGMLSVDQIDPGELSPGEFAHRIRTCVQPNDRGQRVSVVVIDSLNGYMNAMPHEQFLTVQMHEILMYLAGCGVVTFLVLAQHGMLGTSMSSPLDTSYLADTVILFRYFEAAGEIRQAISVVKKRGGGHERTIREFSMKDGRISVGEPLRSFHGILAGIPTFVGEQGDLIKHDNG